MKSGKLTRFFQIKMSNTPDFDAILNADTGLDKDQNDPQKSPEDRLSMLSNATEANLGSMQNMLRGTEVRGTTIGGSKFEESYFIDSIPFMLRNRIKNRIFDVLGDTGRDYANVQVNGADSFSKIERHIWSTKLDTTLDAVKRQKTTSEASLSVVEGLSGILEKSTDMMRVQWEEKAAEAREFLDKRDIFYKIAGLGRKRRFEKYSKRFLDNLADKKAQVQASLNMVKMRKENDMNEAKNKLQAKLAAHNNGDSEQRNNLWKFVQAAVDSPATTSINIGGSVVSARSFGIKNHGDFLEALIALGYTTKADQLAKTSALSADTEAVITKFSTEEAAFKTALYGATPPEQDAPKKIKSALKAYVSPAKDPIESLPKLVADLEKTIRSKKPDFIAEVYGPEALHSPQQKLWKIMCYLNKGKATIGFEIKELNRTTLQNFLKYLKDVDDTTLLASSVEDVDKKAEDYLNDTLLKIYDLWNGKPAIGAAPAVPALKSITDISFKKDADYLAVKKGMDAFIKGTYETNLNYFEGIKDKLSSENQDIYTQRWSSVKTFWEELKKQREEWDKQEDLYQEFQTTVKTGPVGLRLAKREEKIKTDLDAIIGYSKADNEARTRYQKQLEEISKDWVRLLSFGGTRTTGPKKINADSLTEFCKTVLSEKMGKFAFDSPSKKKTLENNLKKYKKVNSDKSKFDARFRDHLMEEYQTEQEDQLEENLKANTTKQWNILNMAPEGEFIEVNYYDTLGVSTLPSAKELNEPANQEKVGRLRIVKKTEKGIVLEDPANNGKTYVLSGPTERKDGVWVPNLGVYNEKGSAIQPGSSVAGIILGINLNA